MDMATQRIKALIDPTPSIKIHWGIKALLITDICINILQGVQSLI